MGGFIGSWVKSYLLSDVFRLTEDYECMRSMDAPERMPAGSCVHDVVLGYEFVRQREVMR